MLGNLIRRPTRSAPTGGISWQDYVHMWERFGFNGQSYMIPGSLGTLTALEGIRNPIILGAIGLRAAAFSEITFAYKRRSPGKPNRDLFATPALGILDTPWEGAATGDLLGRMEIDISMYGNSYWYVSALGEVTWLDPKKMKILTGDAEAPSGKVVGDRLIAYQTQDKSGQPLETFLPNEIVHYRPMPDPEHPFRGLSWMSALLDDIVADKDQTDYKHSFLNNAATPNLVVNFTDNITDDAFNAFRERLEAGHRGATNGFKTMYMGAGADVKVVGSNFSDLDLSGTQSYGETRLCVAAGVPASLLGIAEGMKGSSLNQGNYAATRRRFSDLTMRPLWRMACKSLEVIAPPPPGAKLWYDDREVAFLMADMQDQAAVRTADSTTVVNLTNAGYTPESVVEAITTNDWSVLVHSGLVSVQLQPIAAASAPAGDPDGTDDDTSDNAD